MTTEQSTQPHPHGKQMNILNVIDEGGNKQFSTDTENIKKIFLHPEVRDRKIVVLSVIGAYRKGKSFFLDYCLRFLYAKVSTSLCFMYCLSKYLNLVSLSKQQG